MKKLLFATIICLSAGLFASQELAVQVEQPLEEPLCDRLERQIIAIQSGAADYVDLRDAMLLPELAFLAKELIKIQLEIDTLPAEDTEELQQSWEAAFRFIMIGFRSLASAPTIEYDEKEAFVEMNERIPERFQDQEPGEKASMWLLKKLRTLKNKKASMSKDEFEQALYVYQEIAQAIIEGLRLNTTYPTRDARIRNIHAALHNIDG